MLRVSALWPKPRAAHQQPLSSPSFSAPPGNSSPASKIGLSTTALRQVMLYSSTATVANVTLVSKEMRHAFAMCKDELVTKLLHLRSPRMAKVMKLAKGMAGDHEGAADVTQLYRDTVEVESEYGTNGRDTSPPPFDLDKVIISFELTTSDEGGASSNSNQ